MQLDRINQPLISIIIPTYNNADFILNAINSVLSQTYNNIECIVVNDGSNDNTTEKLANLISEKKIFYHFQTNKGLSNARNSGILLSRGTYLLFLDADDLLTKNSVYKMVTCINENNCDMCVGLEKNNDNNIPNLFPYHNHLANLVFKWWPVSSVLIKKSQIIFDEELRSWEVIDFFAKHLIIDYKCCISDFEVTLIDHSPRQNRLTFTNKRYEPEFCFNFFNDLKYNIISSKKMDLEINEAIDKQLLSFIYTLYINKKKFPEKLNHKEINLEKFHQYNWHKPFGLSGFCRFFGIKKGVKIFYLINRFLKRT